MDMRSENLTPSTETSSWGSVLGTSKRVTSILQDDTPPTVNSLDTALLKGVRFIDERICLLPGTGIVVEVCGSVMLSRASGGIPKRPGHFHGGVTSCTQA